MGQVTDKIRMHMGEGELSEAIDTLAGFLKTTGGDLYNQALLLKGKYKEFEREKLLGMGDKAHERSQLSMAVLSIADDIDERQLENPPTAKDFKQMAPDPKSVQHQQHVQQQQYQHQNAAPKYVAQCFFQGDMGQYYLANNDSIWMYNPLNFQSMPVGMRMPSQDYRFAWTFYVNSTGIYYLVDHAGIIWGQNYGMPVQVGYVRNL